VRDITLAEKLTFKVKVREISQSSLAGLLAPWRAGSQNLPLPKKTMDEDQKRSLPFLATASMP